jgi:hypothetical protein
MKNLTMIITIDAKNNKTDMMAQDADSAKQTLPQ